MSRSQPNEQIPNPATRWFSWNGGKGNIRYYDKEKKENITVELPFDFILLDELSTIKGWHDDSEAGIYANEVRDTRNEPFVVKSHKLREPLSEGFYSDQKDHIKAKGGYFVSNCYISYTGDDGNLALGSIQFHGSALGAWMEFKNDKENRPNLFKYGVSIFDVKTGKKGGITFQVPQFKFMELNDEVGNAATALDMELQQYLKSYFKRARIEQAEPSIDTSDEYNQTPPEINDNQSRPEEDEIPF